MFNCFYSTSVLFSQKSVKLVSFNFLVPSLLEGQHWTLLGVEDAVDDAPPWQCDVRQINPERDTISSLPLFPVVKNLHFESKSEELFSLSLS